ncbi:MAG TPA: CRTAC1 family protein [Bryobacteraceae bacterium]|nr:CRTAC1 family protein [Bryobacteraceae bacterium]
MNGKTLAVLAAATLIVAGAPALLFRETAKQAGLEAKLVSGSPDKHYIVESMTGGVAILDYNNDGWPDIYLVNGSTLDAERAGNNTAEDHLYRNNRDGTFTDVTHEAGLGDRRWTMGVAVADVNNDGFDDIYITNYGKNRLYLNNGDGTFRDFSRESGTELGGWSSGAAFADFDGDGLVDLYVGRYLDVDILNLPREGLLCRYRDIPVQCGPRGLKPSTGHLFRNMGGGHFQDVTAASGIGSVQPSYGLGAVWGDLDNDGKPDLFVANDSLPNYLFHNDGKGRFTESALDAGVALRDDGREQAGMGVDIGDYDNDGNMDIVLTTFSDDYKTLFHNDGTGHFADVSYAAGLVQPTWNLLGWGVQFADMDNDGYPDIVMANGHVYPEVDQHEFGTKYKQHPSVFLNLRNGRFKDVGSSWGPAFQLAESSRGLAAGSLSNNGSIDLVISNLDATPWIVKNPGRGGNWLLLRLRGTISNRDAIGARVTARTGQLTQTREVKSGGSYQSQNDFRLHFGLGTAATVDEIKIRWPSGQKQVLKNVKGNQILTVEEPTENKVTGLSANRRPF